jgi:hypothetical protein
MLNFNDAVEDSDIGMDASLQDETSSDKTILIGVGVVVIAILGYMILGER